MATNKIPQSFPSLFLHVTEAWQGAHNIGAGIPLLINTEALIGADRLALIGAQDEYQVARGGLVSLSAARKAAFTAAWDFCFTARDVITFYCGREYNDGWRAAGWIDSLAIPQQFDELYTLVFRLISYFTANPTHENTGLGITAANAQTLAGQLQNTNQAFLNGQALSMTKRDVRDGKVVAVRKRLSGLCKELSQRLEDLDPRWRQFGFNLPGAPTVPAVPEGVAVFALPGGRLQISCDPSAGATSYRFYAQRPILDPVPVAVGSSEEPLLVTEPLTVGQVYRVFVSAVNEGAESLLSDGVNATPVLSAAA